MKNSKSVFANNIFPKAKNFFNYFDYNNTSKNEFEDKDEK